MTTNNEAINFFNIDIDNVNMCTICHEPMHIEQTYTLPECKHAFHTSCIVTWFRTADSECPYCRNKGVNYISKKVRKNYGWISDGDREKLKVLRAYIRRKDANKNVKKYFDRLDKLKKEYDDYKKSYAEFEKKIKNNNCAEFEGKLQDLIMKARKMRSKRRDYSSKIRKAERAILELPVVPIIIPRVIDLS